MITGRPRYTTPPDEEVVLLGENLVKWSSEPSEELRSRFCEWYTLPEINLTRNEWEALIKLQTFRVYYERARAILGRKFIDGTINPSIGHRLMWHYVPEAAEQEKEKLSYEAEVKSKFNNISPPNDSKLIEENNLMKENARLRKENDELKSKIDNKP